MSTSRTDNLGAELQEAVQPVAQPESVDNAVEDSASVEITIESESTSSDSDVEVLADEMFGLCDFEDELPELASEENPADEPTNDNQHEGHPDGLGVTLAQQKDKFYLFSAEVMPVARMFLSMPSSPMIDITLRQLAITSITMQDIFEIMMMNAMLKTTVANNADAEVDAQQEAAPLPRPSSTFGAMFSVPQTMASDENEINSTDTNEAAVDTKPAQPTK